jgi:hypothetical protein
MFDYLKCWLECCPESRLDILDMHKASGLGIRNTGLDRLQAFINPVQYLKQPFEDCFVIHVVSTSLQEEGQRKT